MDRWCLGVGMKPESGADVWLNGQRLDGAVPANSTTALDALTQIERDRGLHYGHGVFETIRVVPGQDESRTPHFNFLSMHLERLKRGLVQLEFFPGADSAAKIDAFVAMVRVELLTLELAGSGVFKIIVTAGSAERGYGCKATAPRRFYFWSPGASPFSPVSFPASSDNASPACSSMKMPLLRVLTCRHRLGHNAALAGIKHLNRLEQVLGANEVLRSEMDDGLMLDHNDKLIETTTGNIFLVKGNQILTPDLTYSGISGVLRSAILNAAALYQDGHTLISPCFPKIIVRHLHLADLWAADEVFITNCVKGVRSIGEVLKPDLSKRVFSYGPITKLVQAWFEAVLQEQQL